MLKDDVLFVVVFFFFYKKSGFKNFNINCSNNIFYYNTIGGVMFKCNQASELFIRRGPWPTTIFANKRKKSMVTLTPVTMYEVAWSSLRILKRISCRYAISGLVVGISIIFKKFGFLLFHVGQNNPVGPWPTKPFMHTYNRSKNI